MIKKLVRLVYLRLKAVRNLLTGILFGIWIMLMLGHLSCDNNQASTNNPQKTTQADSINNINNLSPVDTLADTKSFLDTFRRFVIDDYPVPPEMLKCNDNFSKCEIKYNGIISIDKVWFTNDSLKQSLVFEMYTDGFRVSIFHFSNNHIPVELIKSMELHKDGGDLATDNEKLEKFKGFLSFSRKLNSNYFKSIKGFKLFDPKEKILKAYGKPDSIKFKNGLEEYEWNFIGDLLYDGKEKLRGKPMARDNYGHRAIMYFKNNRLSGLILSNDIP